MTRHSTTRAVLYGRVSRDRHGEGRSVDSQLAELRATAEREDWQVVAEHRDDNQGVSRYSKGERDDWPVVVSLITEGRVDVLAVWSLSRATRDRAPYAALVAACVDNGVRLHVGGRYVDPSDPDEAFGLDVEAAFSVREAGKISKDTRRGQAHAAAEGRPHGPTIWPYRRVYNSRGALERVELIDERAEALRDAARAVLDGGTLTAEAKRINAMGLDDRAFQGRTLRRLLLTPTVAGLRVHRGRVIGEGDWPAVLDLDTHRRIVAFLSEPQRRCTTTNTVKHLLPGLALCGRCGAAMRRVAGNGRTARLVCSAKHHVSVRQEPVEEWVEIVLIERLSRPDALAAFQPRPSSPESGAAQPVEALHRQLAEWEDAAAEGQVTAAAFGRIEARLLAKIEAAEAAARPVEVPEILTRITSGDVPAEWARLSMRDRRRVIGLLATVTIMPPSDPETGKQLRPVDRVRIEPITPKPS